MKNIFLIIVSFTVALSLAENKTDTKSFETKNQRIDELIYSDDNLKNSDNLKKRDSGYSYPKPSRIKYRSRFILNGSSKNRGKFSKLNAPVRPFETYGPPKQTSQQFSINNHPSRRPSLQQNKNKFHPGAGGIRFPSSNLATGNFQLEVPSPIKEVDFTESSPIASQNEEPFKLNSANYLPPKNQKLPVYQTSSVFLPSSPSLNLNQHINDNHNNINGQRQNLINQQQNPQISDAAQFLIENSQDISRLYDTPALNINYAPINENPQSFGNQVPNFNLNFQNMGHEVNQNRELLSVQNLQRSFPSYATGTLEPYRALEQIQSLEKDRLIVQLQQELVQRQVQDPSRYAQQSEGENEKLLSVQSSHLGNSASVFGLQGVQFGTKIENSSGGNLQSSSEIDGPSLAYGFPSVITPSQTTSSTTISNASVDRPQNSGEGSSHGGTLVPTSSKLPTVFPFPQSGGFIPTLIAGTNLASLPSYGTTFVGSNSFHSPGQVIESSPTHFDIPIPTASSNNKPLIGGSTLTPTIPRPINSPGSSPSLHPIPSTPLQPIFPAIPTVTQVQAPANPVHPTYNQPAFVNSVLLKPVKPVYPVYYYPNVSYHLQKPQYIYPWNYAPSYSQVKSPHTWK